MATRCEECGSASKGFDSCPWCGHELTEPAPSREPGEPATVEDEPAASPRDQARLRRWITVVATLWAVALMAVAAVLLLHWRDTTQAASPAATPTPAASTPATPPASSTPASPAATPTSPSPVRLCWNGSRVTGTTRCPAPAGVRGLAAASPTFAAARREGRCRPLPAQPGSRGFLCAVGSAQLRFAWFATAEQLDASVARSYRSCRIVSYAKVCSGPGRYALRYADPRFRLIVSASAADRARLLKVPLVPAVKLLQGQTVS